MHFPRPQKSSLSLWRWGPGIVPLTEAPARHEPQQLAKLLLPGLSGKLRQQWSHLVTFGGLQFWTHKMFSCCGILAVSILLLLAGFRKSSAGVHGTCSPPPLHLLDVVRHLHTKLMTSSVDLGFGNFGLISGFWGLMESKSANAFQKRERDTGHLTE